MTPSRTIEAIRGLQPRLAEVRRFAATLEGPLDPVVTAYLDHHVCRWSWTGERWFGLIEGLNHDPNVDIDISLQPYGRIEIIDWSAVWLRWSPCRAVTVRLFEPPYTPCLDALSRIDRATGGQLVCDLGHSGLEGEDLAGMIAALE